MDGKLAFFLGDLYKNGSGVSENVLAAVQKEIGFEFPPDYLEVMREFDGGEGSVGKNGYLILFSLEETVRANKNLAYLMKQIPDYYLIGQDAADTGYAFYKPDKSVHRFGLMSIFPDDPIDRTGNSFTGFLEYLYNS